MFLDAESSSRVALALRNSLAHQIGSPAQVAERIQFFENPAHTTPPFRVVWGCDVAFTNWSHSDLQGADMDFGWGKPFEATAGGIKKNEKRTKGSERERTKRTKQKLSF